MLFGVNIALDLAYWDAAKLLKTKKEKKGDNKVKEIKRNVKKLIQTL